MEKVNPTLNIVICELVRLIQRILRSSRSPRKFVLRRKRRHFVRGASTLMWLWSFRLWPHWGSQAKFGFALRLKDCCCVGNDYRRFDGNGRVVHRSNHVGWRVGRVGEVRILIGVVADTASAKSSKRP